MKFLCVKLYVVISVLILAAAWPTGATDLTFSFPEIPVNSYYNAEGKPAGHFIEMYRIFKKNYTNGNLTLIGLYPFKRSLLNISSGIADIHFPMIRPDYADLHKLPYDFLPEKIGTSHFVLYTRADDNRPIKKDNIERFTIEVQRGHSELFDFKTVEGNSAEQILKKLLSRRIDGYVDAQDIADSVIIKNKYKNLKRQLFKDFDVFFVIPKGKRGVKVKKAIGEFIKTMTKNPEFIKNNAKIDKPYIDWQPYNTDWP